MLSGQQVGGRHGNGFSEALGGHPKSTGFQLTKIMVACYVGYADHNTCATSSMIILSVSCNINIVIATMDTREYVLTYIIILYNIIVTAVAIVT